MAVPQPTLIFREREGSAGYVQDGDDFRDMEFVSAANDNMDFDHFATSMAVYSRSTGQCEIYDPATSTLKMRMVFLKENAMKLQGAEAEIRKKGANEIMLSPKGTYIVFFCSQTDSGNNLFVHSAADGSLVFETASPEWPCIHWNLNESICVVNNQEKGYLVFEDLAQPPTETSSRPWTHVSLSKSVPTNLAAVYVPNPKQRATKPSIIEVSKIGGKPLFSHELKADDITVQWNHNGTACLFHASLDYDSSGKSYYGEAALFLFVVKTKKLIPIHTEKTSIHDVKWSPRGTEFIVVYGTMPNNRTTMISDKGEVLHNFDVCARNTVCWSPHGRLVVLAGFGNLPGDIEVWDREKLGKPGAKVASWKASSCTFHAWSPCSTMFLCATTSPRMTIDNKIVVFRYTGEPLFEQKFKELLSANWAPFHPKFYKQSEPEVQRAQAAKPAPKAATFRAAGHSSSGLASRIKQQLDAGKSSAASYQKTAKAFAVSDSFMNWRGDKKEDEEQRPEDDEEFEQLTAKQKREMRKKERKEIASNCTIDQAPEEDYTKKTYKDVAKALKAITKKFEAVGKLRNTEPSKLTEDQREKVAQYNNLKAEIAYLQKLQKEGIKSQE